MISIEDRAQQALDRWMADHGVLDFPTYQCVECRKFFNRKDQVCHCRADVRMVHEPDVRMALNQKRQVA
jgi:hypothetical protein